MHRQSTGGGRQYIDVYFEATQWSGEPAIGEPTKCDELRWVEIDGLPKNTVPYIQRVLQLVAHGETYSEDGWHK